MNQTSLKFKAASPVARWDKPWVERHARRMWDILSKNHRGHENAITAKDMGFNKNQGWTAGKWLIYKEQKPVGSWARGYYVMVTREEFEAEYESLRNRGLPILERAGKIKELMPGGSDGYDLMLDFMPGPPRKLREISKENLAIISKGMKPDPNRRPSRPFDTPDTVGER